MAGDEKYQSVNPHLVTKIIASYVAHHNVAPESIPELIGSVQRAFEQLGQPIVEETPLVPAVPVRRSVQRDAVTCLDCGWKGKMLRRHLSTRHGLSGEEYLRRWGLPADHPLTAPMYSQQRSVLAKELGLGRGRAGDGSDPEPNAPRRGRPRREA